MVMLFNNTGGCYDCIPPSLTDIAVQRLGCPPGMVKAHTITQRKMRHYIKTGSGVSQGFISFVSVINMIITGGLIASLYGPIWGVGQGGGGNLVIWPAIILMMLQAYKKTNKGIEIVNSMTNKAVIYWINSYVDDDTIIIKSFGNNVTVNEMLQELKESLLQWDYLLHYE